MRNGFMFLLFAACCWVESDCKRVCVYVCVQLTLQPGNKLEGQVQQHQHELAFKPYPVRQASCAASMPSCYLLLMPR
jgi:hypothetical protein